MTIQIKDVSLGYKLAFAYRSDFSRRKIINYALIPMEGK